MHFTYLESSDHENLHQGDIIKRSPEINGLLEEVHPHYHQSEDYKFFIILTQTCDLIKRGDAPPKSRYITIAAVRPLNLVVQRYANSLLHDEYDRILNVSDDSRKAKLSQFAERLLNNNEPDYFYLRKEPSVGLMEDHCAFLKLSIALKSELHYPKLLASKILQLTQSFQHKLGYLVGNSYARIGTDDWLPNNISGSDWKKLIEEVSNKTPVSYLSRENYKFVIRKAKGHGLLGLSQDMLDVWLAEKEGLKQQRKKEVIEIICNNLSEVGIEDSQIEKARDRFLADQQFNAYVK